MNLAYGISQVMHRIRVKLYPNYLPNGEAFLARTDSEASLSIEQVCAAMRERGGFKGDYRDLIENIKRYNDEVAYQLCNGFRVSNEYYSIYPNLGGTFKTARETPDPKKHPLTFRFRVLGAMRKLAAHIQVINDGEADVSGYIDIFTDTDEHAENSIFVLGNMFVITGSKIKIEGTDPGIGLYLVPVDNPAQAVKVDRISENTPGKITGIMPSSGHPLNRLEIRTQFTGSNTLLKNPRAITSDFVIEEVSQTIGIVP